MDYNPCFSHLVMERSLPTSPQTEATEHRDSSVQGHHADNGCTPPAEMWLCPISGRGTPLVRVIFVATPEFPDCTDSLIKGGPRRESVWLALDKPVLCVWPRDSP